MTTRRLVTRLDGTSASPRTPDDDELVARAAAGHDAAFEQLVARWGGRVRDYLLHLVGDAAAADDLLQEVLVALHRRAATRDRMQPFAVWLFCVARHAALSHQRKRAAWSRVAAALAAAPRALLSRFERRAPPGPADALLAGEFAAAFERALKTLPEEFRSVFLLREREELSYEEIAVIVGIPAKTVSTRLVRARERLRHALAPWLDDPGRSAP